MYTILDSRAGAQIYYTHNVLAQNTLHKYAQRILHFSPLLMLIHKYMWLIV